MIIPNVVDRAPVTVVGLQTHFEGDDAGIRDVWTTFGERWSDFEELAETDEAFGVVTDFDEDAVTFDDLVGVATPDADDVPDGFVVVAVPGGSYAVFETSVASFEGDDEAVLTEWLPDSGYERRPAPEFERYGASFDPDATDSSYQYYLPVAAVA